MTNYIYSLFCLFLIYIVTRFSLAPIFRQWRKRNWLYKYGNRATGQIVDYAVSKDVDGVVYYHPVVEFKTDSGEMLRSQLKIGNPRKEKADKKVLIYYDNNNPDEITTRSGSETIFFLFSLLLCICGISIGIYYIVWLLK
jgi:hypothetical protein